MATEHHVQQYSPENGETTEEMLVAVLKQWERDNWTLAGMTAGSTPGSLLLVFTRPRAVSVGLRNC